MLNITFQHTLTYTIERRLRQQEMLVLDFLLLLDLAICMQATIERLWVK
jgi:hypothetical protein